MKNSIGIIALVLLIFSGCDWDDIEVESFDYDLQRTWVSTRTPGYSPVWPFELEERGQLVITYDTITITGSVKPFNAGYTKGIALEGYSEETSSDGDTERGTLFIKDKGTEKDVPYLLWRNGAREYMLTIGTDPNDETFKRE
jgi:hypothetical protein